MQLNWVIHDDFIVYDITRYDLLFILYNTCTYISHLNESVWV